MKFTNRLLLRHDVMQLNVLGLYDLVSHKLHQVAIGQKCKPHDKALSIGTKFNGY